MDDRLRKPFIFIVYDKSELALAASLQELYVYFHGARPLPGGVVKPEQYLTFDRLATECGNNTLRITTRQGFQFHGV